ncbi:MAG: hypothetical protein QXO20_07625 [Candidatus Bathyarchaeia archaeon]
MNLKNENFNKLATRILDLCRDIADQRQILGACICGYHSLGLCYGEKYVSVLLVIDGFQPLLLSYIRVINGKYVLIQAVDKKIFEKDVREGFLGDALAINLALPYVPVYGRKYLEKLEIMLKYRFLYELLVNLILEFPELSSELYIKPEYFVVEALTSRARLFPLLIYDVSNFLSKNFRDEKFKRVLEGYNKVLNILEKKGVIEYLNDYIRISSDFADKVKTRRNYFMKILKSINRAFLLLTFGILPQVFKLLSQSQALKLFPLRDNEQQYMLEDSKAYLFISTANGLTSIATSLGLENLAKKALSADLNELNVEKIGGIFNDVYLVRAARNGNEKKVVIKSFRDWTGFKWVPLSLWTIGTKNFALSGRKRLEKECSINRFLYSRGFAVPMLIGMNPAGKLVCMEYVEGETIEKVVKRIMRGESSEKDIEKDLKVIRRVGENMAKIHALGITLGDTKPENMLLAKDGKIYFLDLEQASRNGDKAWDVAEFLYYSGRYTQMFDGIERVKLVTLEFIKGYMEAGGSEKTVREAGKSKYARVFVPLVLPHVIITISKMCQKFER